jgi:S-adenosylmethionine-diacylglycerol 3-amino-3-carboxypropyl transferase
VDSSLEFWRGQPLLFGQVREDAETERWLASRHDSVRRAVVIASAGCTALSLADCVSERLDAIDINARQVALTSLKLAALRSLGRDDFLRLLCGPVSPREVCASLSMAPDAQRLLAELPDHLPGGLQNAGRVDRMMRMLRSLFFATVHDRGFVEEFLRLSDAHTQAKSFDSEWHSVRWHLATETVFNRLALSLAFGRQATHRMTRSFAADVRGKIRDRLTTLPCLQNGHAWQDFLGCYPRGVDAALPSYARSAGFSLATQNSSKIRLHVGDAQTWLARQDAGSIDFFALSNILELSPPETHAHLLEEVERTGSPGAILCLRSILPFENQPGRMGRFCHHDQLSQECHKRERALICNRFQVFVADGP